MKQIEKCSNQIVLIIFILFSTIGVIPVHSQNESPNVILILADDMGWGDIASFNGGLNKTPNLDKLLEESVYFSHAYSGSPVCTPSRAALLTGRYPHRTGAITLNMERFPRHTRIHKDEVTIADVFSKNGYVTGLIGKWHSGDGPNYHPMKRGFQEFEGFKGYDVTTDYFNYKLDINGHYQSFTNEYLTDNLTDRAVNFLQRHQNDPFFLHLAHYAPHRPLSAPKKLVDFYLKKGFNKNTSTVYAMIEIMDKGIGKLLSKLDELGIRNNTLIIFASDNGPDPIVGPRYNHNLKGMKYSVNEGGIRVPLLVHWESTLKNKNSNRIIHFTDIFPTLLEICNLQMPQPVPLDGGSIANILYGKDAETELPKYRFWQWNRGVPYYTHNAAMLDGKWKLVRPLATRNLVFEESDLKPMLYNLEEDPEETIDISEKESMRYKIMKTKLEQWSREVEWDRVSKK